MINSADPDLQKLTDLDLHWLQRQGISGFSRKTFKMSIEIHQILSESINCFLETLSMMNTYFIQLYGKYQICSLGKSVRNESEAPAILLHLK